MNFQTVIAVDRLNSWVRSDSRRAGHGGGIGMVYYMKGQVLANREAEGGLRMAHKRIKLNVKCRDCSGSGRYIDSYGQRFPHCRACMSTGTVVLRFIETVINDQIRWHTPDHKFPYLSRVEDQFWYPTNWQPNQTGKDMEPWEVAAAFNQTEPCFRVPFDQYTDYGTFNHFRYSLWVGKNPRVCEFCGSTEIGCGNVCTRNNVCWIGYACKECHCRLEMASVFDKLPFPEKLTAHPEIQRWRERHSAPHTKESHLGTADGR